MTGENAINKPVDSARGTDTANRPQARAADPAPGPASTSGPGTGTQPAPQSGGSPFGGAPQGPSAADGRASATAAVRGGRVGNSLPPALLAQTQDVAGAGTASGASQGGTDAAASASQAGTSPARGDASSRAGSGQADQDGRQQTLRQQAQPFRWGFASGPDVPVETVGNFLPLVGRVGGNEGVESTADRFAGAGGPRFFAAGGLIVTGASNGVDTGEAEGAEAALTGGRAAQGDSADARGNAEDAAELAFQSSAQKQAEAAIEGDEANGDAENAQAEAADTGQSSGDSAPEPAPIQDRVSERLQAIFGEASARYADVAALVSGEPAPRAGVEVLS